MPSEAEIEAVAIALWTAGSELRSDDWQEVAPGLQRHWRNQAVAALSAASAVRSEGVKVRALEWSDNESETPFGPIYVIHDVTGFLGDARYDLWRKSSAEDDEGVFLDGGFGDWDAAASAAQEHYTNAVLSAIETSPVQTREDGIREALKIIEDFREIYEEQPQGATNKAVSRALRLVSIDTLSLLSQPKGDKT